MLALSARVGNNEFKNTSLVFLTVKEAVVDEESTLWPTAIDQRSIAAERRAPDLSAEDCFFLSLMG